MQKQTTKSLRFAFSLNLILPGAGQFYLGQRVFGCVLAVGFLVCFVGTLVIFFRGYAQYFQAITGGDILQSNILEQLGTVFHVRWLLGLIIAATMIFIVSLIGLYFASKKANAGRKG